MPEELGGNYGLIVSPTIFEEFPHFGVQIAKCLHLWSEVEYALADIVFSSSRPPPEVAVRDYFSVFTSAQRLKHVDTALDGSEYQSEFAGLRTELTRLASERAKIAHGRWGYRPDKPDEILMFPHAGERFFKNRESTVWRISDFENLARELQIVEGKLSDLDARFFASLNQGS
jgi:hypothetical protein